MKPIMPDTISFALLGYAAFSIILGGYIWRLINEARRLQRDLNKIREAESK